MYLQQNAISISKDRTIGASPTVSKLPCSVPSIVTDAFSRLNQANPKDPSIEKEDIVRFVAQESTPVSLTPREIKKASENDPELSTVRQYMHTH